MLGRSTYRRWIVAFGCSALCHILSAQVVSLNGAGWTFRTALGVAPHMISVPDCWPNHAEYRSYIGSAIYERDFEVPAHPDGSVIRLHFDAVYARAHIWLNGRRVGNHDGGYTPFEFDVSKLLVPGANHLTVEVDNSFSLETIPGLATAASSDKTDAPGDASKANIFGWWTYGGIPRDVTLKITAPLYIENFKIEPTVNLAEQSVRIHTRFWLHNAGVTSARVQATTTVAGITGKSRVVTVAPQQTVEVDLDASLLHAHLWSMSDPYLYHASVVVPGDIAESDFGVRDVRVRGTELLLNGKPVHAFGANRVSEDPQLGLIETASVIERDLGDMLAANMRMMRIAHYPQSPALLDYADRHGMLLIEEAGNWNLSGWQMEDSQLRATWQSQMREMIERDWNHPSIIAWSVGNEYESASAGGLAWTRDMRAFTLDTDATRLITFASRFTFDTRVHSGDEESSRYSDFVSINMYGQYAAHLDRAHALWPNKPIFVTEFGKMGEPGLHDPRRIADIQEAVSAIKSSPWAIGGSLWTWADYRSRRSDTPADGIRIWGVVTFDRQHRDSWNVVHDLFQTDSTPSK